MSARKVSSGSATTSASMRGRTSTSIGSSAITSKASISSRIFIAPSSAVIAEPERPAIMIEVSSTPSSRSTRMPTRSTVNGDAPKRASWKMPCWATIAPTRKLISRMIGAPRSAKISRW